VEAELHEDTGTGGFDVLLARDVEGQVVGLVSILRERPRDGYPWTGLLIVHGDQHGKGYGRLLADLVEERLRAQRRNGVRLAVLENNPTALTPRPVPSRRTSRAGENPAPIPLILSKTVDLWCSLSKVVFM
jgi:hypothetical protein